MAESLFVDAPIQLKPFHLEPKQWAKDTYSFGLAKAILRIAVLFLAVAAGLTFLYPAYAVTYFLAAIVYILLILAARWRNTLAFVKNPLNRFMWVEREIEFDSEEVRINMSNGVRSQIPVKTFVGCVEHRGYYFLQGNSAHIYPAPYSAFASPADEREFRQVLYRHNLLPSIEKK